MPHDPFDSRQRVEWHGMTVQWEMVLVWALALIGIVAAIGFAWLRGLASQKVAQLEKEAFVRQSQLEAATSETGELRATCGGLESALRSETGRRSAAEEIGKRVPLLESNLDVARDRGDRLASAEAELRERIARIEADLAAANGRAVERDATIRQLSGEREAARSESSGWQEEVTTLREQLGRLESALSAANARTQRLESDGIPIRDERDQYRSELEMSRRALAEKTIELQAAQTHAAEKISFLQTAREQLADSFKAVAGELLQKNSKDFSNLNQENLATLLNPLKERIAEFGQTVTGVYDKESRERLSLQQEIRMLSELHTRMSQETENLTRALKGSGKTQGTWGELVLETLLAGSGLRQGQEYVVQQSLLDEEGHRLQPDVVVNLPDQKYLVVDSKVSLTAYERFCRAEEGDRAACLREHLESMRRHVRGLASKNYQTLYGIRSPDFVLMFVAVESAYMLGMQEDPELYQVALKQNVLVVCPSTLIATLRLVDSVWRYEHQNRNAQEIARVVGQLYDKFVGFVGDMQAVGQKLTGASEAHEEAYKKLMTGRGNLVKTAERVKKLGVKPTKSLPAPMVELAADTDEEETGELALSVPANEGGAH
jgi:DNA recombination protein RmuC